MSLWIVLPTYNEADTIRRTLERLRAVVEAEVLIVDDGSPDGTGELVQGVRQNDQHLHLISRTGKLGLGTAYQEGFRYALAHGATTIIQMDADGSHDPTLIPTLLTYAHDVDLVLASRYVPGGSFPIVWYRRWISTLGNVYIRALLGWGVQDWSTGYKVWRGNFVQQLLQQRMDGVGYAWLMEMTWLARRQGGRIAEVPLVFQERQGGQSKFSWRIALEDIRLAWRLNRRR